MVLSIQSWTAIRANQLITQDKRKIKRNKAFFNMVP